MKKKRTIYGIILVLLCSILSAVHLYTPEISQTGNTPVPSGSTAELSTEPRNDLMTVHFLDVGQADSIFIDFGAYEILVDGGNKADGPLVADYIDPYIDDNLDLLIATHAHEDHIGGLCNVIASYQIGRIIYSGETSSTISYQDFFSAASTEPGCLFTEDGDMVFDLDHGAQFRVMELGDGYKEPNENSVVTILDYNDIEVLLMGDLESRVEKANLFRFFDIDVLKVGHHGSKTASSQDFLNIVKPEVSIISAGLNNQYSLPSAEIITRLHSIHSSVYGTFRSGTIILTTDGLQYRFNSAIPLTLHDAGAVDAK